MKNINTKMTYTKELVMISYIFIVLVSRYNVEREKKNIAYL